MGLEQCLPHTKCSINVSYLTHATSYLSPQMTCSKCIQGWTPFSVNGPWEGGEKRKMNVCAPAKEASEVQGGESRASARTRELVKHLLRL